MRRYLAKVSGRSLPQITRLIRRYRKCGSVQPRKPRRHRFPRRYTDQDIALLAAVDAAFRDRRCAESSPPSTSFYPEKNS